MKKKNKEIFEKTERKNFWDKYKELLSELSSDKPNMKDSSLHGSSSEQGNLGFCDIKVILKRGLFLGRKCVVGQMSGKNSPPTKKLGKK